MSRLPMPHEPNATINGSGTFGVQFTRYVVSGAPGGYSTVETIDLFRTREERDALARKLRKKYRGSNPRTRPVIETFEYGDDELSGFEPWATRVVDMTGVNRGSWGYVHAYTRDGAFRVDSASWPTKDGLVRGMTSLWNDHEGTGTREDPTYPLCTDCHGVQFFTDEAPRLRVVIETGEDDTEPAITAITRPVGMPDEEADQ